MNQQVVAHHQKKIIFWSRMNMYLTYPLAWSSCKSYCWQVKRKIRLAEKEFMEQQIKENRNNTNTMWKVIRSGIPKKIFAEFLFRGRKHCGQRIQ